MKIALGCDHGGLEHKNAILEHLKERGFEVQDFGIYEQVSVDYPEIALKVANSVAKGENELGILVCGTGIGMSLAANKVKGIRAAACNPIWIRKSLFGKLNTLGLGSAKNIGSEVSVAERNGPSLPVVIRVCFYKAAARTKRSINVVVALADAV